LEQTLAYEEAVRQRREGDKKLKVKNAEKEEEEASEGVLSESQQNTAMEALMTILNKYPNSQEHQDLQFLLFKIEQGEHVIIDGIEDLVIRNGLTTMFKAFKMKKVKQEDGDMVYMKSASTPNLLEFFDSGLSRLPKIEDKKKKKKKKTHAKRPSASRSCRTRCLFTINGARY